MFVLLLFKLIAYVEHLRERRTPSRLEPDEPGHRRRRV